MGVGESLEGGRRYRLLDSLRQYGRERLLASGQSDVVYQQHAAYYLRLAEEAEPELDRAQQAVWIERLALDQGDVPATRALLKESLGLYRQHQDLRGIAWVLIHLGWLCNDSYHAKAARRFLHEALNLCRQLDDSTGCRNEPQCARQRRRFRRGSHRGPLAP